MRNLGHDRRSLCPYSLPAPPCSPVAELLAPGHSAVATAVALAVDDPETSVTFVPAEHVDRLTALATEAGYRIVVLRSKTADEAGNS
jgi:hypothetical protein